MSKSGAALPEKMKAIRDAGFDAIELAMPDILAYKKELYGSEPNADDLNAIVEVAKAIKSLANDFNLKILMLKPFEKFEGWKKGRSDKEREDSFARARGWIRVMVAAETDMLQVSRIFMERNTTTSTDRHGGVFLGC